MTRKDFELIARVIRSTPALSGFAEAYRDTLADAFADELSETNPRFNRSRFLAAALGEDE